jgi:hypothetical protein
MSSLKEKRHEMVILFEGLNILISIFCVCANHFFHIIKNLQQRQKDLHSPVRPKSLIGQKSKGL